MTNAFKNFAADVRGVTLIEYGLIAALIAVSIVLALSDVGTNMNTLFNSISTSV